LEQSAEDSAAAPLAVAMDPKISNLLSWRRQAHYWHIYLLVLWSQKRKVLIGNPNGLILTTTTGSTDTNQR
jgi:hypothetical protein